MPRTRIPFVLFFLSGLSSLVLEVAWVRQFSLTLGNTVLSTTAVLAAFMGGLALGSFLAGRVAPAQGAMLDPGAPIRIGMIGDEGHTYMVYQGLKDVPGAQIVAHASEDGDWDYNCDGSLRNGTYDLDSKRKWIQSQQWGKTTKVYETFS